MMNNLVSSKYIPPNDRKRINKCALKILGIDNSIHSDEEVLEFLANYVQASSIASLLFDSFNNFYIVFLMDLDAACLLVGKKLNFNDQKVDILPLLDYYIVRNVHFSLSNDDVSDIFRTFGNVYEVDNHKVCPNSSKFSHVLSGQRELSFLLPGKDVEVHMPGNVTCLPYNFLVKKFCSACLTEGHSILSCPDIEESNLCVKIPKEITSDEDEESLSFSAADDLISDVEEFKEEKDADAECINSSMLDDGKQTCSIGNEEDGSETKEESDNSKQNTFPERIEECILNQNSNVVEDSLKTNKEIINAKLRALREKIIAKRTNKLSKKHKFKRSKLHSTDIQIEEGQSIKASSNNESERNRTELKMAVEVHNHEKAENKIEQYVIVRNDNMVKYLKKIKGSGKHIIDFSKSDQNKNGYAVLDQSQAKETLDHSNESHINPYNFDVLDNLEKEYTKASSDNESEGNRTELKLSAEVHSNEKPENKIEQYDIVRNDNLVKYLKKRKESGKYIIDFSKSDQNKNSYAVLDQSQTEETLDHSNESHVDPWNFDVLDNLEKQYTKGTESFTLSNGKPNCVMKNEEEKSKTKELSDSNSKLNILPKKIRELKRNVVEGSLRTNDDLVSSKIRALRQKIRAKEINYFLSKNYKSELHSTNLQIKTRQSVKSIYNIDVKDKCLKRRGPKSCLPCYEDLNGVERNTTQINKKLKTDDLNCLKTRARTRKFLHISENITETVLNRTELKEIVKMHNNDKEENKVVKNGFIRSDDMVKCLKNRLRKRGCFTDFRKSDQSKNSFSVLEKSQSKDIQDSSTEPYDDPPTVEDLDSLENQNTYGIDSFTLSNGKPNCVRINEEYKSKPKELSDSNSKLNILPKKRRELKRNVVEGSLRTNDDLVSSKIKALRQKVRAKEINYFLSKKYKSELQSTNLQVETTQSVKARRQLNHATRTTARLKD